MNDVRSKTFNVKNCCLSIIQHHNKLKLHLLLIRYSCILTPHDESLIKNNKYTY